MKSTTCTDCGEDTGRRLAKYCDSCRWRHRGKPRMYTWTPERDAFLRAHYSTSQKYCGDRIGRVWGMPGWAVRHRARTLGLARAKPTTWTPEQVAFLDQHAGKRPSSWLWRHLPSPQRTETAIVVKLKRLRLSRLPEGYSQGDLATAFGVSRDSIERWQRQGWLTSKFQPRAGQPYRVTDGDVIAFMKAHPGAFTLGRVDQLWFLALVFGDFIREQAA